MTILVVDNNPSVRRLLQRLLAEIDAAIVECADGAFALDSYNESHPDIVLMDVRMPLMDGLTATRQILRNDPAAQIVIVTDYDDDDLRNAATQAGACAYFTKQDLTQLAELIRSGAWQRQ